MSTRRSTANSAVAALNSADLQLGYMTTTSADGRSVVVATDANVLASPTGVATGAVLTPAMAGQTLDILEVGRLEPIEAPFVGAGNATDYAARDALGRIVRQVSFAANVVGVCAKDGSVTFLPVLGSVQGGGGGGGGAGFLAGAVDGTVTAAGQVLTTANDTLDAGKMTRATATARRRGFLVTGITLTVPVLGLVLYAIPGSTVPAALMGFVPTGTTSWAVVDASGNVARKTQPEAQDIVLGEVNERGNLYFWEHIRPNSELVATHAPYFADNTGATDASDALRQMFADAVFTGIGLAYSCKPCRLPKGMYLLNKPINIQQRGLKVFGEGEFTSSLRVQNYVGPAVYVSAQFGSFPTQPNVMGGRQALIFKHEAVVRDVEWLVLSDDGAGTWWHGKSAFSIQIKCVLRTTTDSGSSFFIASYGRRATDDNAWGFGEAIGCGYAGIGHGSPHLRETLFLTVTTTAGIKSVWTSTGSMVPNDGQVREIEFNLSGGFMRIFIDGVQQTLQTGAGGAETGALAGTIVQNSYESVCLGIVQQLFLTNLEFHSVDMWCTSIRGSDIGRHTSGHAPDITNRYTNDSNTMFGLCTANASDADDLDGVFVRGVNRQTVGTAGAGIGYFPLRQDNVATVPSTYDVVLEDFSISNIYGTCILTDSAPQTRVHRMGLTGQNGLCMDANTFFGRVDAVKIQPANLARIGFRGAAALNTVPFSDMYIIGFDYGFVVSGGADIIFTKSMFVVACKKGYMMLISVSALNASGCDIFLTDENSAGAVPDYFFFLSAIGNSTFANAVVAQAENANAPVWAFSGTGTFGPTRHVFLNTYLGAHPSSAGLMKFLPSCNGTLDLYHPFETPAVPRFRPGFVPPTTMMVTYHPDVDSGTLSIAMADADLIITREQHLKGLIEFTGALTAPRTISMPPLKNGRRLVTNSTTGGQNLLFKQFGGAVTHTVTPGTSATLWVNNAGTELVRST